MGCRAEWNLRRSSTWNWRNRNCTKRADEVVSIIVRVIIDRIVSVS